MSPDALPHEGEGRGAGWVSRGTARICTRGSARAVDVRHQGLVLRLHMVVEELDDVADRDDPDQLGRLDEVHRAPAAVGHEAGDARHHAARSRGEGDPGAVEEGREEAAGAAAVPEAVTAGCTHDAPSGVRPAARP